MLSGKDLYLDQIKRKQQQGFSDALAGAFPIGNTANSTYDGSKGRATPMDMFIGNLPKAVIQGTARGVSLIPTAISAIMGNEASKTRDIKTGSWWENIVFGEGELSIKSEVIDPLVSVGASQGSAEKAAGPLAFLMASLDILPGGRPVKMALSTFLKTTAKTTDINVIKEGMKAMDFSDETIVKWGTEFQKANTVEEVEVVFKAAGVEEKKIRLLESAPLNTVDKSDPITVNGKVFSESVDEVKTKVTKAFDNIKLPSKTSKEATPSLKTLTEDIAVLKKVGVNTDEMVAQVDDLRATIRTEPERFSLEVPKERQVVRGGSLPKEDSLEPVFVTQKTEDGVNYARGYTLKESIKTGKQAPVREGELVEGLKIFDANKAEDIDTLRKSVPEEVVTEILEASKKSGTDWRVGKEQLKAIEEAGFDGVRLLERPSGSKVFNEAGQQVSAKGDIFSTVVFKKENIKWSNKGLDEVANPLKDKLGMLSYNLQARYGKGAVTKGKLEKFKAAEDKVFFEILRFVEEVAYAAEKGVEVTQSIPSWVPQNLRSITVFENVTDMLQRGVLPKSHSSREMALYTEMVDEVARRVGIIKRGPKPAIDPAGAILESTRANLRTPGDIKNPLIKSEVHAGQKMDSANSAEYTKDYSSPDEAYSAYSKFQNEKDSSKQTTKKSDLKPYGVDLGTLTDTSKFKSVFKDIYRNAEKVFGEKWPIIKEKIFDPFDAAKGRMVDEEKMLTDWLQNKIVKDLGIKKRSKLSRAVMDLGEGTTDYDAVVKEFGKQKADNVVEAARLMRVEYDRMITEVNVVQKQIYPNNPEKWTPRRKDYFRHYDEMSIGFSNMFEDPRLSNLPSTLRPDDSRNAKSKWQSFKQERLGIQSRRDAVGGFLNYVPQFAYTKHIDPETARMRGFVKDLEEGTETSKNLGNFIEGTRKWVDDLAGQANFVDRFAEYAPGGRWTLDKLDFLNKRAKRNAILGNLGASISQIFNVPGAIASAGPVHSTKAVFRTMGEIIHVADVRPGWEQGVFIKERYRNSMYDKFDTRFIDQPMKMASWMLGVLDEVGTKFAWNAHYTKALAENIDNPVKYADDMARKSVAGRGIGEVPILQKSKVFQMVAPFQLEVMNQWWLMGEFVDKKESQRLATLFAAYFIFNEVSEEVKGTSVGFDPIQAFYDSYKIYEDELLEGDDKAKKIAGRLSGEVIANVPMGSYVTAGVSTIAGMSEDERKDFFGDADPVRFGNVPLGVNAMMDPLFGILPTWGGSQLKKTWGGIRALAEGAVRGKDGEVLYDVPVEPGVQGALQNILFGPHATNFAYKDEVEAELLSFYKDNKRRVEAGQGKEVKADLDELPEDLKSVYLSVAKDEIVRQEDIAVKNMTPTFLIASALVKEGKTEEAKKILDSLDEKEKALYVKAAKGWKNKDVPEAPEEPKEGKSKTFQDRLPLLMQKRDTDAQDVSPDADKWVIQTALDYAYAFGTNPEQAFEVVFMNNDIIKDTIAGTGGVVRTERMPFKSGDVIKGSDKTKGELMKEMGLKKGKSTSGLYFLEHNIPLGIGGSNKIENLFISTKEEHDAWTAVENFLIDAVKEKKIGYQEAQELIVRHRGRGGVEPISFEEIQQKLKNK